jgi:hypothetical protein
MSKVYAFHMVALKAGARGPDSERYFHEVLESGPMLSGMTIRLLKGDRGDREGKYLVMFEFESVERRNQLFPEAGPAPRQTSEEFMQWMSAQGPTLAKWDEYATPTDVISTDYREV